MEQAARGDRRGQQQPQVLGQEERRERGDDAAEGEEREEGQEQPGQAEAEQVVAELRVVEQLPGEPERSREERGRDTSSPMPPNSAARSTSPRSRRRARLRDDQTSGSSR